MFQSLGISILPKYWGFKTNKPTSKSPNKEHMEGLIAETVKEKVTNRLILIDECVSLLCINVTDMFFLNNYLSSITALCEKHKVKKLFAFGSVLTNKFTDKSDIDLVVDFENIPVEDYADNYFSLKDALSAILHRDIDLLEDKAIRNPILRRNIDNSKLLIYG